MPYCVAQPKKKFSQFSHLVVSDSLWPHGLQHVRLPCPSPTPGEYSNSCPSSQWFNHPSIQPSHPLSCPLLLPSIFPGIRVFSNESFLWIFLKKKKKIVWWFLQKLKMDLPLWSSNSPYGCIPQRTEKKVSKRYFYTHVHSSSIHSSRIHSLPEVHPQRNG